MIFNNLHAELATHEYIKDSRKYLINLLAKSSHVFLSNDASCYQRERVKNTCRFIAKRLTRLANYPLDIV